ncbi:hypothetical protein ES703_49438 [subsurface metagenome]
MLWAYTLALRDIASFDCNRYMLVTLSEIARSPLRLIKAVEEIRSKLYGR